MSFKLRVYIGLLFIVFIGFNFSHSYAQTEVLKGEKLKQGQVPKEVLSSFKIAYPMQLGGAWVHTDENLYCVSIIRKKQHINVCFSSSGEWIKNITEIGEEEVPLKIHQFIQEKYAAYKADVFLYEQDKFRHSIYWINMGLRSNSAMKTILSFDFYGNIVTIDGIPVPDPENVTPKDDTYAAKIKKSKTNRFGREESIPYCDTSLTPFIIGMPKDLHRKELIASNELQKSSIETKGEIKGEAKGGVKGEIKVESKGEIKVESKGEIKGEAKGEANAKNEVNAEYKTKYEFKESKDELKETKETKEAKDELNSESKEFKDETKERDIAEAVEINNENVAEKQERNPDKTKIKNKEKKLKKEDIAVVEKVGEEQIKAVDEEDTERINYQQKSQIAIDPKTAYRPQKEKEEKEEKSYREKKIFGKKQTVEQEIVICPDIVKTSFERRFPRAENVVWKVDSNDIYEGVFINYEQKLSAVFMSNGTHKYTAYIFDKKNMPIPIDRFLKQKENRWKKIEGKRVVYETKYKRSFPSNQRPKDYYQVIVGEKIPKQKEMKYTLFLFDQNAQFVSQKECDVTKADKE